MTHQVRDKLLHNGTEIPLVYSARYPPDGIADAPSLPENHPKISHAPTSSRVKIKSSCWRGYRGTWEIKTDGRLYLISLDSTLYQLQSGEPLFADWVSGTIYLSEHEILHIKRGCVISKK
jgi:hypothetical protein